MKNDVKSIRIFSRDEKKQEDLRIALNNDKLKFKKEIEPRYNYQIKDPYETQNLIHTFEDGSIAMVKNEKNN